MQKVVVHFTRAVDQGCTAESVKTMTTARLIDWWKEVVESIEVVGCFSVADCQVRSIVEAELLRRDKHLEIEDLYRQHFPNLADYEDE